MLFVSTHLHILHLILLPCTETCCLSPSWTVSSAVLSGSAAPAEAVVSRDVRRLWGLTGSRAGAGEEGEAGVGGLGELGAKGSGWEGEGEG